MMIEFTTILSGFVGMTVIFGGIGVLVAVFCGSSVLADKTAQFFKRRGVKPGMLRKIEVFSKTALAFLCVSFAVLTPFLDALSMPVLCFLCAVIFAVTVALSVAGIASEEALAEPL